MRPSTQTQTSYFGSMYGEIQIAHEIIKIDSRQHWWKYFDLGPCGKMFAYTTADEWMIFGENKSIESIAPLLVMHSALLCFVFPRKKKSPYTKIDILCQSIVLLETHFCIVFTIGKLSLQVRVNSIHLNEHVMPSPDGTLIFLLFLPTQPHEFHSKFTRSE